MPKKHQKKHMRGGFDFGSLISKGLSFAKKVKDSGVIGKSLDVAKSVASALGKDNLASKLDTAHGFAQSVGAGRKHRSSKRKAGKKLRDYSMKSPTQRAEVVQMDGANQLYGSGRHPHHLRGGGFFDILGDIARIAVPIASQLLGHGKKHGGALNLAGRGLSLAGGGREHDYVPPTVLHHATATHRARPPRQLGSGSLGRASRGMAVQILS